MDNARAIHFEDDPVFRRAVSVGLDVFSNGRHQVVGEAASLAGALAVLEQIHNEQINVNVVLLDGNLNSGSEGHDAQTISGRIKELGLAVMVIGLSGDDMSRYGVKVDIDVTKKNFSARALTQVLDDLQDTRS